jgi:site-specific recombinase XerD
VGPEPSCKTIAQPLSDCSPVCLWAKLVAPAPTFHDLRYTHASAVIADGWDVESASARLGHRDPAATQRAYIHELDAANRSDERRAKLAALDGNPMETTGRNRAKQKAASTAPHVRSLRAVGDSR